MAIILLRHSCPFPSSLCFGLFTILFRRIASKQRAVHRSFTVLTDSLLHYVPPFYVVTPMCSCPLRRRHTLALPCPPARRSSLVTVRPIHQGPRRMQCTRCILLRPSSICASLTSAKRIMLSARSPFSLLRSIVTGRPMQPHAVHQVNREALISIPFHRQISALLTSAKRITASARSPLTLIRSDQIPEGTAGRTHVTPLKVGPSQPFSSRRPRKAIPLEETSLTSRCNLRQDQVSSAAAVNTSAETWDANCRPL